MEIIVVQTTPHIIVELFYKATVSIVIFQNAKLCHLCMCQEMRIVKKKN